MTTPVVFVLDRDPAFLDRVNAALAEAGYIAAGWVESTRAYQLIRRAQPDALILNLTLEKPGAGWAILDQLRADPMTRDLPVIVAADDNPAEGEPEPASRFPCQSLSKPFDLGHLLALVHQVIATRGSTEAAG